ncbi:putative transcription factor B3-Domain family [Helianthus debilis subsp. tardiflorus]
MRRSRHNSALQVQDDWPIRKALTLSDVDITHPFLTLPRQPVETYILVHLTQSECEHLLNREQVPINAQDDDTGDVYIMKLKWRGSYYNLIGKWGRIVRSKGLDVGQVIKIRWFDGCLHFSVPQQDITVPPLQVIPAPTVHDQWPIRKVLTLSDVDTNHPFLPLARRSVEDHILVHWTPQQRELLRSEEQVNLNARDVDTGEIYVMKLRWRGNYYNLIGKWGKIIRSKGLGVGKEIKIRWANGCLHFSVPYEQVIEPATIPVIQHRQQQQHHQHQQQQHHHHHQQQHQHQQQQHYQQQQHDEWPIKKALTLSDVDTNHPFLTLPGKSVEDHILLYWASQAREQLRNEYQINVNARDYDTGDSFLMKLKCRGSYYNLIGKWGQIIRSKGLQVGQEIKVCWDNGYLVFSVPE